MNNVFTPPFWLRNPHLQTIWASYFQQKPNINIQEERIELPDGDFIDLAWHGATNRPIVLVLHGLAGNVHSGYVRRLLFYLAKHNLRGVLMHFRGCSGIPNRKLKSYHGGQTEDLEYVLDLLHRREPHTPLFAVGYSLGGNVLLKYLGEQQDRTPLSAAVAISPPFDLEKSVHCLSRGFSRIYQWKLIRELMMLLQRKAQDVPELAAILPTSPPKDLFEFDDTITAPLHGFTGAKDYYERSSSCSFLPYITKPTRILQAIDDPFSTPEILGNIKHSKKVSICLIPKGGHVGFIAKKTAWLENEIRSFLNSRP